MKRPLTGLIVAAVVVAPRRGAWVETLPLAMPSITICVAPRRGAWVETPLLRFFI